MTTPSFDVLLARRWARFFADRGYNALPSINKRPAMRTYSAERDNGLSAKQMERFWSCNIQVATGSRWGLVVVDLDGPMAADVWRAWTRERGCPPTWTVRTRRGFHLWFAVPRGGTEIPHKTVLWELEGARHAAVEVLGDRNLAMAPPSLIDPASGTRYAFVPGRSPAELDAPAAAPEWLLDAVHSAHAPRYVIPTLTPARRDLMLMPSSPGHFRRDDVIRAIPDKVAVAEGWGLRPVTSQANASGWLACRSAFRDDRNPSAMFSVATGRYWEVQYGRLPISLFDLGALIGPYPTWLDCLDDLGRRHNATEARRVG